MTAQTRVGSGTTISETANQVLATEATYLPDLLLPMNSLCWSATGSVVIPGHAEAQPTDWSRQQIASLLGVHFEKWFATATHEERAEEMTRRLRRSKGNVRLRLAEIEGTVVLRAMVSTGYAPIRDSSILELLGNSLAGTDARVRRLDLTERMTAVTICIGEPQSVGGVVGSAWGSLTMVNSGVGWSGLTVSISLIRLVCSNGMRAPLMSARLIDVRHRHVDIARVRNQLVSGLRLFPKSLTQAVQILDASTSWEVRNVEAETREVLREAGMVRRHLTGVLAAYRTEQHQSVFGISQAMTRHAQSTAPEDRVALEELAGTYVARSVP